MWGEWAIGLLVRRELTQLKELIERSKFIYGPLGADWQEPDLPLPIWITMTMRMPIKAPATPASTWKRWGTFHLPPLYSNSSPVFAVRTQPSRSASERLAILAGGGKSHGILGDIASHADEYAVQAIDFCFRYNNAVA